MGMEFGLAGLELSLQPQLQTVKKTTWFLFLLFFVISCLDDPECFELRNDVIGVAFRVMGSGSLDSVFLRDAYVNGLEFPIAEGGQVLTNLYLPLNYFETQTDFRFVHEKVENTLKAGYQNQVQYVSDDCGPRYTLSNLAALENSYDSVRIVNSTPSAENKSSPSSQGRHIEIFRCPVTDTMKVSFNQLSYTISETGVIDINSEPVGADLTSIVVDGSAVLYPDSRKTTVKLPVDLNSLTTAYTVNFSSDFGYNEPSRAFEVTYEKTTEERYRMCGVQTFVTDLLIKEEESTMDSISIARDSNDEFLNTVTDPYTTNIKIYRCPPTNYLLSRFITDDVEKEVSLIGITADYTSEVVFYKDTTVSRILLPLNESSSQTTFTITYTDRSETMIVNYTLEPLNNVFQDSCKDKKKVRGITVDGTATATVDEDGAEIVYPFVNNITIEVP
jgi:hypothetical protein